MSASLPLIVAFLLASQDPVASDLDSVTIEAAISQFEVEVIGSGAPEVLVWFGSSEPSPAELAARRDLGTQLRMLARPGEGRVHLLVDLGPKRSGSEVDFSGFTSFAQDFPQLRNGSFQAECLQRSDSRAFAQYLVTNPGLVGLVNLPGDGLGQAPKTTGNLADFVYMGLGLGESTPEVLAPVEGQSGSQPLVAVVLEALQEARIGLKAGENAVVRLGGELWQFDLDLIAPRLSLARPDPHRTYRRLRLALELVGNQAKDEAAKPALVELAWRAPGKSAFERLAITDGRFEFPGGRLPSGVTLRAVARVPIEVSDVEFLLDARYAGRTTCLLGLTPDPSLKRGQASEH